MVLQNLKLGAFFERAADRIGVNRRLTEKWPNEDVPNFNKSHAYWRNARWRKPKTYRLLELREQVCKEDEKICAEFDKYEENLQRGIVDLAFWRRESLPVEQLEAIKLAVLELAGKIDARRERVQRAYIRKQTQGAQAHQNTSNVVDISSRTL